MALSDAQIDRFSRQIVLPQIGGAGQERLLGSAVALAGEGELAAITALYLVGAGVGRFTLHGSHSLCGELRDLNPEAHVTPASGALGSVDVDVLVACDRTLAEIDRAALSGRPIVAGGVSPHSGWLVVAQPRVTCASCAARQAVRGATGARPSTSSGRTESISSGGSSSVRPELVEGPPPLASATAGVVGALMSLAVVKLLLGLDQPSGGEWLQFDAVGSTLTAHSIVRAADCPRCAMTSSE
jgi:molybdopterin-synthase adenylyltransferase